MTTSLDHDLILAFNPCHELWAANPLQVLLSKGGDYVESGLTAEEMIVQGSMVKAKLERELGADDYRILDLYYHDSNDLELLQMKLAPLREAVRKESKIYGEISMMFLDLVCATEFWNENLFVPKRYGYMSEYNVKANQASWLNGKRRKRIVASLQDRRKRALKKAEAVIYQGGEDDGSIRNVA